MRILQWIGFIAMIVAMFVLISLEVISSQHTPNDVFGYMFMAICCGWAVMIFFEQLFEPNNDNQSTSI